MFDGKYFEWNQKRIKAIIEYYGYKEFYGKKIADLGCGHADLSGSLYRLGSEITAIDARQEHLKIVSKKFAGVKVVKANLDGPWPFFGQKFDLILDLALICHLASFEDHLKAVCASTTYLVLETAVCDSSDPNMCVQVPEGKDVYDLAYSGMGCRPTAAAIERVLTACGMTFKRMDNAKFNAGDYVYDWQSQNDNSTSLNKRRIWFAVKNTVANTVQDVLPPQQAITLQPVNSNMGFAEVTQPNIPPLVLTASPKPPTSHHVQTQEQPQPTTQATTGTWKVSGDKLVWDTGNNTPAPTPPPPPQLSTAPNGVPSFEDPNKRFVIVIPSYNNSRWCVQNINSALTQNYDKFRIIFTDDCSSDDTFAKVSEAVNASPNAYRVTLIKNTTRMGALANLYNMIMSCDDDEIILTLDGDDWFPHDNVLGRLREVYTSRDIWLTYGQYKNSTDGQGGVSSPYPQEVVDSNSFRSFRWGASHLRTFYTWLFKRIKKEDLMKDGVFFQMTWDFAMMFPMLEMSGSHSQFLSDILYVYNLDNPINDHKVSRQLQASLDGFIRSKPRYARTQRPPVPKTAIGLLLIATGKYHRFIQGLISSADNYFMDDNYDVTYFLFSDANHTISSKRNIVQINIEHRPFPYASMDRFKHFTKNADKLNRQDYLFYVDIDCLFVDRVNSEILGDLVGVQHCGFVQRVGPYEENPNSVFYVQDRSKYKQYYGGGFSGGKKANYLALSSWCSDMIDKDVSNGIIPVWHDETAINRYFLDHPPLSLTPSYHYPQSNIERYKKMWGGNVFHPRIMLLDKDHHNIRQ